MKTTARVFRDGSLIHFESEVKELFSGCPVAVELDFTGRGQGHLVIKSPSVEWVDETFCKSGDFLLYPFNALCSRFCVDYRLAGNDIVVGDGNSNSW